MRSHDAVEQVAPRRVCWVVAAPGTLVDWDVIVSEDEDGVLTGWAFDEDEVVALMPAPRRRRA